MATGPSAPALAPPMIMQRKPPTPRSISLEKVKEEERRELRKKKGYMSTIITRGGLGEARVAKKKALGE